jgi:hypothetical protein
MTDPAIATAADYADALLTARRAKNLLVLLVVLMLLIQLAVFFIVKYTGIVYPTSASAAPTTAPASEQTWHSIAQYAVGISVFVGVAGTILTALVLYLITQIMVVGRLIGVSRVISALIWTFVVLMLIFPWQAFLRDQALQSREWIFPGVLYSWNELLALVTIGTRGRDTGLDKQILHWARFVAWPAIAIMLLLAIQVKSNRGLRQALGEEAITTDFETPTTPKTL